MAEQKGLIIAVQTTAVPKYCETHLVLVGEIVLYDLGIHRTTLKCRPLSIPVFTFSENQIKKRNEQLQTKNKKKSKTMSLKIC